MSFPTACSRSVMLYGRRPCGSLLSTTAVFTALWLTGVELNITALMGMTMIIGIGTEMAIFYVSEYTELSHTLSAREALRTASLKQRRGVCALAAWTSVSARRGRFKA